MGIPLVYFAVLFPALGAKIDSTIAPLSMVSLSSILAESARQHYLTVDTISLNIIEWFHRRWIDALLAHLANSASSSEGHLT